MNSSRHHKEDRFICAISRIELTEREQRELQDLIAEGLDWDYLFTRAKNEGISPFIYYHVKKCASYDTLSYFIKEFIRQSYFQNVNRNTTVIAAVKEIGTALKKNGIEVMVLKGIYLAEYIYKNIALRPVGDLDLLIRKSDLERANHVLVRLGYVEPLNIQETIAFNGTLPFNSLIYSKKGEKLFIHIHWHLINSTWPLDHYVKNMEMEHIWAHSETYELEGITARTLSPEHQILYLAHHALHHSFTKLIYCVDLSQALIMLNAKLDKKRLEEEALRFGMKHILKEAIHVCSRLLSGRKARYSYGRSYLAYFAGTKGVNNKRCFMRDTIFPKSIVLANSMRIPLKLLKRSSYAKRISDYILRIFPIPKY